MNRDEKAAVIDRVAGQIEAADAVIAVDYRGLSVKQASDLRGALREADASFQIVKNTLTERAADQAGAESLKELLEGPTAFAFVNGDVAVAAKALARFRRELGVLEWKGGRLGEETLTPDQIESISALPARDVLHGQLVGTIAAPLNGLVRGLASLISGLAIQLEQIREKGLVGGSAEPAAAAEPEAPAEAEAPAEPEAPADPEPAAEAGEGETEAAAAEESAPEEAPADAQPAEEATEAAASDAEAPGDPVAEGEAAAEQEETSDTPSEGEGTEEG